MGTLPRLAAHGNGLRWSYKSTTSGRADREFSYHTQSECSAIEITLDRSTDGICLFAYIFLCRPEPREPEGKNRKTYEAMIRLRRGDCNEVGWFPAATATAATTGVQGRAFRVSSLDMRTIGIPVAVALNLKPQTPCACRLQSL